MNNFLMRLLLTAILLLGLGAVAYGLLRYPSGARPGAGQVLSDYASDLGGIFRERPAGTPEPAAPPTARTGAEVAVQPGIPPLESFRGDGALSLALAQVVIPDSGRLPASMARTWDDLRTIHASVLPESIAELGRLRTLSRTDKPAFERDRAAVRTRLATARAALAPYTQEQPPHESAVKLLAVLERLDALLAGL